MNRGTRRGSILVFRELDRQSPGNRRGFSLIGLIILLAVLAAIATVAIRSNSDSTAQGRQALSSQALRDIKRSVVGPTLMADFLGGYPNAFVVDMGRVPKARLSTNGNLSLNELFIRTHPGIFSLPAFQPWQIHETNVVSAPILLAPLESGQNPRNNSVPAWVQDRAFTLSFGWRGPYHYADKTGGRLMEGWGRWLESLPDGSVSFLTFGARSSAVRNYRTAAANEFIDGVQITSGGVLPSASLSGQVDVYKQQNIRLLFDETGAELYGNLRLLLSVYGSRGNFNIDVIVYLPNPDGDVAGARPIIAYYQRVRWNTEPFLRQPVLLRNVPAGPAVVIATVSNNGTDPAGQQRNVTEPLQIRILPGRLVEGEFIVSVDAEYTLTTGVSPNNSGSVSVSPAGFGNQGRDYLPGAYVTLTAIPGSGRSFVNWSEGTGGSRRIIGTSATLPVQMYDDRNITANFQ